MALGILGVSPLGTTGSGGAALSREEAESKYSQAQGYASCAVTVNAGTPTYPLQMPMLGPGGSGQPTLLRNVPVGGTTFTELTRNTTPWPHQFWTTHQGSLYLPEDHSVYYWGQETHGSAAQFDNVVYRYDLTTGQLYEEYPPDPLITWPVDTPPPESQPEGYCWSQSGIPYTTKSHDRPWGQHGFRQYLRSGMSEFTVYYESTAHCWLTTAVYDEYSKTYKLTGTASGQLNAPDSPNKELNPAWVYNTKVRKWSALPGTGVVQFVKDASSGVGFAVVRRSADGCYYCATNNYISKLNPVTGAYNIVPHSNDANYFAGWSYQNYAMELPNGKLVFASGSFDMSYGNEGLFVVLDPNNMTVGGQIAKRLTNYPELSGWRFVNVGCFLRGYVLYMLAFNNADWQQNKLFAFDLSTTGYPVTDTGVTVNGLGGGTGNYQLRTDYIPEYDAVLIANNHSSNNNLGVLKAYRFTDTAPISATCTGQGSSSCTVQIRIPVTVPGVTLAGGASFANLTPEAYVDCTTTGVNLVGSASTSLGGVSAGSSIQGIVLSGTSSSSSGAVSASANAAGLTLSGTSSKSIGNIASSSVVDGLSLSGTGLYSNAIIQSSSTCNGITTINNGSLFCGGVVASSIVSGISLFNSSSISTGGSSGTSSVNIPGVDILGNSSFVLFGVSADSLVAGINISSDGLFVSNGVFTDSVIYGISLTNISSISLGAVSTQSSTSDYDVPGVHLSFASRFVAGLAYADVIIFPDAPYDEDEGNVDIGGGDMAFIFHGDTKTIELLVGTRTVSIKWLYSRWKDWLKIDDNSKYLPAFRTVGGDPTIGVNNISTYYFLLNGWKIKPPEENCTIQVSGILLVDGGGDPFLSTNGDYNVRINMTTPMQAETVVIETGVSGLTPEESSLLSSIQSTLGTTPEETASAVWSVTTRTLTSFGITPEQVADAIVSASQITPINSNMVLVDGELPQVAPTSTEIAGAVRVELAQELSNLDAKVSKTLTTTKFLGFQ